MPNLYEIEELDDGATRRMNKVFTIDVPHEFVDSAILTLSWSETWEEDPASSSKDDTLSVDDNNRELKNVQSAGPYSGHFRIVGTDRSSPDADLKIYYTAKAIATFEAN